MSRERELAATRRTVLRAGAAVGGATALGAAGALGAGAAAAATANSSSSPYPPYVTDTSHATPQVAEIFRGFYTAKSEHNAAQLMSYFSKTNAFYIDASSGTVWPSWESLNDLFTPFFASGLPADAISYPLRIVGDTRSALVEFEDTPELFGSELRILGSVTFDTHQKIVRWIDYWDGRSALVQNAVTSSYPTYFKDQVQRADPLVVSVAKSLQQAYAAGDPAAALAHVEGSRQGGGYEWTAAPVASPMRRGHTCIELDPTGKISRLTTIYDSGLLSYSAYTSLVGLSAEGPL